MLEAAGEQTRAFDNLFASMSIESLYRYSRGTRDRRVEAGNAETAFLLQLHPVANDEFRVDERDQIGGVPAD